MAGDEHFPELLIEMFETGTELLVEALPSVWDGSCKDVLVPQVDADATKAAKVQKEEAELDLSAISAAQVHNRVRAFSGNPNPNPNPNPNSNPNPNQVWDGSCKDVLVPQVDADAKP